MGASSLVERLECYLSVNNNNNNNILWKNGKIKNKRKCLEKIWKMLEFYLKKLKKNEFKIIVVVVVNREVAL